MRGLNPNTQGAHREDKDRDQRLKRRERTRLRHSLVACDGLRLLLAKRMLALIVSVNLSRLVAYVPPTVMHSGHRSGRLSGNVAAARSQSLQIAGGLTCVCHARDRQQKNCYQARENGPKPH